MKLIRFLKSKTFFANALVAILVLGLIFLGVNLALNSYTRHGDNVQVPDLRRLSYEEAIKALEEKDLMGEILDTAEFNSGFPRSSIIEQYPVAGAQVKIGREIRLTINPEKARKIELPQLIEKTKRRAIYDLESKGFKVGTLSYVPYIGKDVVVEVKIDGETVHHEDKFEKGTEVELVLGQGLGDSRIAMPYLRFLNIEEAKNLIREASLNIGSIDYDEELQDTALALVFKQYPNPSLKPNIRIGGQVDIWLTDDYTKIPNDSLLYQREPKDTTLNPSNDSVQP